DVMSFGRLGENGSLSSGKRQKHARFHGAIDNRFVRRTENFLLTRAGCKQLFDRSAKKRPPLGRPRSAFSIPIPWTVAVRLTDAALDGPARPAAVPGSAPPATTVIVVVVVMRAMADPHVHRAGRRRAYGGERPNDGERGGLFCLGSPASVLPLFMGDNRRRWGGIRSFCLKNYDK